MEIIKGNPEDIFEMQEKLGEGSYGIVCKCLHKKEGKVYAVKVIEVEGEDDASIQKEIGILKTCQSETIVRYGGCYKHGSTLLIAMEYCDGGSVQDILRHGKGALTEAEISAVCGSILDGLIYLHAAHIMHRDIKSGNVLLTQTGEAKLADFGVSANLTSTFQKKNTVIGSPYWMAPEVISKSNDGYDSRADIWSLGITGIEMAETEPPRYDVHFARVIFLIPHKPPPELKNPENHSEEFIDFITKCLQKDPNSRPTAKDLRNHPFIQNHIGERQSIIEKLVAESLPLIEEYRRQQAEMAEEGTGTYDDSDTVVHGLNTVEVRGADDDDYCGTFVENSSMNSTEIEGLDLSKITTYA
eukprot:CAMPEP_0174262410 /NCGR_PEP_ID=MMETSP0439-20130205/12956_1 /TAXON_ID=0 /ORGANISM="Stereomyxa ramosa, Strain Chinc5" /LENGTH=356 /DNA_ID=CAMNT_0015347109 /DNA_START=86 /DNA_END=1156 /DNA_ORIENTATION=-